MMKVDNSNKEMVAFLLITVAVWYRFWTRRLKNIEDNHMESVMSNDQDNSNNVDDIQSSATMVDRISGLPDEILSFVLSHLTLRDAVRVTTLSKRWRNVFLPSLDLDWHVISGYSGVLHSKECELNRRAFLNSVDQVIRQYKDIGISSFRFSFCYSKEHAADIDRLMDFAAKKRLRSLKLNFICMDYLGALYSSNGDELYIISSLFFSQFPYLKDLRLHSCILRHHGELRLNRLVTLDLSYVILEGIQWQCILSSSSTIERLKLMSCNLPEKLCIGDNLCHLSFLMIDNCLNLRELELTAKNLKTFEFVRGQAIKCCFLSVPKLGTVSMSLLEKEKSGVAGLLSNLANNVPCLEALCLHGEIPSMDKLPTYSATSFQCVTRLNLYMKYIILEVGIFKDFPRLLKAFPVLQNLYVKMPVFSPGQYAQTYELPAVYRHIHLKNVELGAFAYPWINFACYLLTSAVNLKRMMVTRRLKVNKGCEIWSPLRPLFNKKESEYIRDRLRGHAISPNADLIIPYEVGVKRNPSMLY